MGEPATVIMGELDVKDPILEVALDIMRRGTPDLALRAAKCLGMKAYSNEPGPRSLEPDGIILAVMKIFDAPDLSSEDTEALLASVGLLVRSRPRLAAQVVAACADPDPRIAFAALANTRMLFKNTEASLALLEAGAVPAVMSALKHPNAYCRAAAASVAAAEFTEMGTAGANPASTFPSKGFPVTPEALKALVKAGLGPALMGIIRAGRSQDVPEASPGLFSNIRVEMATETQLVVLPNSEPALHACNALLLLARSDLKSSLDDAWHVTRAQVVAELVKARPAAAAIMQCLQQYEGEVQEAPRQLICAMLSSLSDQAMYMETFCKRLLEAGLADLLPSVLKPDQRHSTGVMLTALLNTFKNFGFGCVAPDSLGSIAAACAKFVEECGDGARHSHQRGLATSGLDWVLIGLQEGVNRRVRLSQRCVEALAGIMVSGPLSSGRLACAIVLESIERDKTAKVLKAAMSGGFVPGTFRLARDRRLASDPLVHDAIVVRAVQWIAGCLDEHVIIRAVDLGLLPVLQSYLRTRECQQGVLKACAIIVKFPSALALLREAGFVPAVTRAAYSAVELGRWVSKHCRDSGLVAEFVDAGLLEKLEKARSNVSGGASKQQEVEALIDELARLSSEERVQQPQTGALTAALLRVGGKGSAVNGGREQPGERTQDEGIGTASTTGAGGEGLESPRDPDTLGTRRKQPTTCIKCGKSPGDGVRLQMCGRCGKVMYCGQACQRSHWPPPQG